VFVLIATDIATAADAVERCSCTVSAVDKQIIRTLMLSTLAIFIIDVATTVEKLDEYSPKGRKNNNE
jgi:CO dehydrogenase nickel-insertion accessory protein CooC1